MERLNFLTLKSMLLQRELWSWCSCISPKEIKRERERDNFPPLEIWWTDEHQCQTISVFLCWSINDIFIIPNNILHKLFFVLIFFFLPQTSNKYCVYFFTKIFLFLFLNVYVWPKFIMWNIIWEIFSANSKYKNHLGIKWDIEKHS